MPEWPEEEFWKRVDRTGDCWPWLAGVQFGLGQNDRSTPQRWSWRLTHGDIPDDMRVVRTCTTHKCVRPAHLTLMTKSEAGAFSARRQSGARA